MPSPLPILRTDVIGIIGDSISAGFGASDGWSWNFMRDVKAQYSSSLAVRPYSPRQPMGYSAQQYPSYFMNAAPGRKAGDISGIMATVLAPFIAGRTTVYVVELGQNDVTVTNAATFIPQVTAIRDAIRAAAFYRMLIWVSPWTGGEKWPDGANPDDFTNDGYKDKESQLSALMAAFPNDCYFVSWRQLRLNTLNATTNPTNAVQGIFTLDQVHPTTTHTATTSVSGGQLLADWTVSNLTFA